MNSEIYWIGKKGQGIDIYPITEYDYRDTDISVYEGMAKKYLGSDASLVSTSELKSSRVVPATGVYGLTSEKCTVIFTSSDHDSMTGGLNNTGHMCSFQHGYTGLWVKIPKLLSEDERYSIMSKYNIDVQGIFLSKRNPNNGNPPMEIISTMKKDPTYFGTGIIIAFISAFIMYQRYPKHPAAAILTLIIAVLLVSGIYAMM